MLLGLALKVTFVFIRVRNLLCIFVVVAQFNVAV